MGCTSLFTYLHRSYYSAGIKTIGTVKTLSNGEHVG